MRVAPFWYDKIVAPALLALAERRDTELVLSVDNGSLLPWLPADAIVEAPVPIQAGVPQPPRPAVLPLDVRALLQRNCAYEVLAAEAIAEHDRPKALRALVANFNGQQPHPGARHPRPALAQLKLWRECMPTDALRPLLHPMAARSLWRWTT